MVVKSKRLSVWDGLGALTAYVVEHEGRFYMFYTAVPKVFNGPRAVITCTFQKENNIPTPLC
jgi:hypothetical protein